MHARGERMANGVNTIDRLLFAWAALLIAASAFHTSDAWVFRIGMVLGEVGVYVLCRVFIHDLDDVRGLFKVLGVALLPLAALMLLEKLTAQTYFDFMGAVGGVNLREGHVRAYGPFAHPILAGTVGATCVPMALSLWRLDRVASLAGLTAGAGIVFASTSSGPIMMVAFTVLALLGWHVRHRLRLIRWVAVAGIVGLDIVMKDPVYFLMARIDITGGSTGYHRAQLIRSSIEHLGEWWAVGTDYTRHWMATGVHANQIHTDITNHFLGMGVLGGFPLLLLFLLVLISAFREVGRVLSENNGRSPSPEFLAWALGAMLFGQVMNFWSISLFDQSVSFFYLVLAMIGAVQPPRAVAVREKLSAVAAPGGRGWKALRAAGTVTSRSAGRGLLRPPAQARPRNSPGEIRGSVQWSARNKA